MKRFTPILTFFAGCGFMLLISAKNQSNSTEQQARYHLVWNGYYAEKGYAYDAVTGEIKIITNQDIKESNNIKALLERK
jgi:hypothetical protein